MKKCTRKEIDSYLKDINPIVKQIIDLKKTSEYVTEHVKINVQMPQNIFEIYINAMMFIEKHLKEHPHRHRVFDITADLYSDRFFMCIPASSCENKNSDWYESYYFVKWLQQPNENDCFFELFFRCYLKDLLFTKDYLLAYNFIYNFVEKFTNRVRPNTLLIYMYRTLIPLLYAGDIDNLKKTMRWIKHIGLPLLPKTAGAMPIFSSSIEYDLVAFILNESIIPEELIRRATRSGFKNRTYLSKYPEDFLKCLKHYLANVYHIEELPYSAIDISKTYLMKSDLNLPFYIEDKVELPRIHDSEALSNIVCKVLKEAHIATRKCGNKSAPIKKPRNPYTPEGNEKEFDRSFLLVGEPWFSSKLDFSKFENFVECYNNLICPVCKSKLSKHPVGKSKCKTCGKFIYYKLEKVYGRAMILDECAREEYYEFEKTFMDRFYIHRSCQEQGVLEEALTLSQIEYVSLIKSFEKIIKEKILESNDVLQKKAWFSAIIHCYRMVADFRNEIRCVFEEMIFLYKFLGEEPNYGQTFIVFSMLEKKLTQSEVDEIYNDVCEKNCISQDTKEKLWFLLLKNQKVFQKN